MRIRIFSLLYRFSRFIITRFIYFYQKILIKPKDLEPAVKTGDQLLKAFFVFKKVAYEFKIPSDNQVDIFDLSFPSPLIGASFKSEVHVLDMWLKMGLGGLIFKTIMKNERKGNPRPRIQELNVNGQKCLINALGLPGPGLDKFIPIIINSKLWKYERPLGLSLGGENIQDYLYAINKLQEKLKELDFPYFYELNVSCPNTKNGTTIGEQTDQLDSLLRDIRLNVSNVISVKVSPDVSNVILNEIGEICAKYDSIMINAGNTQYRKTRDLGINANDFSVDGGGFSGTAIFSRTLQMVKLFSNHHIPIMATGGISSIEHIKSLRNAGASLFGMATSLVLDPYCIPDINRKL